MKTKLAQGCDRLALRVGRASSGVEEQVPIRLCSVEAFGQMGVWPCLTGAFSRRPLGARLTIVVCSWWLNV